MLIAIDIDEVLADFANPLDKYIKGKFGLKMDRHKWNTDRWWQTWGGSRTTAIGKIYSFLTSAEFKRIKPVPGAVAGVRALEKMGHELMVITGRPAEVMPETRKWLERYFPGQFVRVECTDFHIAKGGHKTKGVICNEFGCQVMIDDFPHYAEECADDDTKVFLFDTGYNHTFHKLKGIVRVKDWKDVVEKIKKLKI